jgi:cell division protease FtsH
VIPVRPRAFILAWLVGAVLVTPAPVAAAAEPAAPRFAASGESFVYSDLLAAMRAGQVRAAQVDTRRGKAKVWLSGGREEEEVTFAPQSDLADRLSNAGARVEERQQGGGNPWLALLSALAVLAVVGPYAFLTRRRRRLGTSPGGDGAGRPGVRFGDVAGCEEAVEEVREFVAFLRDPGRFASLGARMPSGLLLHGPPGTGKTLLAKALVGEAEASFFAASGSDFMERYVGVGASRVRQLFGHARRAKGGAVVFIDELDAIGKRRADTSDSATTERDHTLNQLLVELDGFTPRDRVVCVAATNRIELLDPALLRPGRLSRHVLVDLPSADGRRAILDVHARGKPLADDVDLDRLAQGTAGRSGADLADLLNEGAIIAARAGRDRVGHADLEEGHLRVLAGPAKRSSPLSDEEREVVAYHEAGHALVAELCPSHDKTHRLSIRPRGRAAALAVTAARDRTLHSTRHVHEQLMVLLGGRAAERAVYGHVSSGAANDLEQANLLARRAVTELGFSARAGQLVADVAGRAVRLAEETRRVIDEEVERMIADAYRDAIAMIEEHRAQLDRLAGALVASEELDRLEIAAALSESRPRRTARPEPGPRPEPALRPMRGPSGSRPRPCVPAGGGWRRCSPASSPGSSVAPNAIAVLGSSSRGCALRRGISRVVGCPLGAQTPVISR